jgi:hypothetical protein
MLAQCTNIIPLLIGTIVCLPFSFVCFAAAIFYRNKGSPKARKSGRDLGIGGVIFDAIILILMIWDPYDLFGFGFRNLRALKEADEAFLGGFGPALALAVAAITLCREPRKNSDRPPTCSQCSYILTGITSGRCPECGYEFWPPV